MENGVEALKMASGMLIFVLAITITISVFTSATQALNRIFDMQNSEEYVTDAEGNYLNFVNYRMDGGTRVVGVETIIPSMYRAYKENYAIYFYDSSKNPLVLYQTQKNGETVDINYIDLEKEAHGSAEAAIAKLEKLLYEDGVYETLKGKKFVEKLGEYYMNDIMEESEIAEVNKIKKRIIVYTQQ